MPRSRLLKLVSILACLAPLAAHAQPSVAPGPGQPPAATTPPNYLIGSGDELQIFVWKNPDLTVNVPVRPDGKITTPLVQDTQAQGRTPTELAESLRVALSNYVQEPLVTVVVTKFASASNAAGIRVIGAAATPKTVPYRDGLTALDVLIEVGGLSTFASGNRAQLIRVENGVYKTYPLRLADLLKSGKMKSNVKMMPGDVIRIPQRGF